MATEQALVSTIGKAAAAAATLAEGDVLVIVDDEEDTKSNKEVVTVDDGVIVIPDEPKNKLDRLTQDLATAKDVSWNSFVGKMKVTVGKKKSKNAVKKKIVPVEVIDLNEYEEDDKNDKIKVVEERSGDGKGQNPKKVYCYNCGRVGHSGHECKLPLFEEICPSVPSSCMGRKGDWWKKYAMDTVLYGPRIPLGDERAIRNFKLMPNCSTPSPGLRRRLSPNKFFEDQGGNKPVRFCASSDDEDGSSGSDSEGLNINTQNGGSAASTADKIDEDGLVIDYIPVKKPKRN